MKEVMTGKVKPMTDNSNLLGKLYAETLRTRAKAVLAAGTIPLAEKTREAIAADLEALAVFAECRPDVFGVLNLQMVSRPTKAERPMCKCGRASAMAADGWPFYTDGSCDMCADTSGT